MSKRVPGVFLALLLAAMLAASAQAQINVPGPIDPLGNYLSGLTEEDRTLINDAAARIYQAPTPKTGQIEKWKNPESGNYGSVKLTRQFTYKGMSCLRLSYRAMIEGHAGERKLRISRCKTASGEWKIL